MNLQGSAIIITGSATGLGSTVARRAASRGANVLINYTKSEAEAVETADACRELGVEALVCQADVVSDQDCRRMAAAAVARWGRLDGLVNNAGQSVFASSLDLESLSSDDFLRIYSVNVVGAYQMTRAVAPHLKATGAGAIVNVSSISSITGSGSSIAYAASKGALNTMTTSLARALAPEIRVNAVSPGPFHSRWWNDGLGAAKYEKLFNALVEALPLKAVPTQESIAETVVWLLEDAGHVTGETVVIDSGMRLLGFEP
jgi:3-oxoacyl-[acyl-carrier protein] reductase